MHTLDKYPVVKVLTGIVCISLVFVLLLIYVPSIDIAIHTSASSLPPFSGLMIFFSGLAEPALIGVLIIGTFIALAVRKKYSAFLFSALSFSAVLFLSGVLKEFFSRARPLEFLSKGYGFPSGHVTAAVVVYGVLSLLLWKQSKKIALSLLFIPILVGISRILLGMHWLSDVIGGILFGSLWLLICYLIVYIIRKKVGSLSKLFQPRKI